MASTVVLGQNALVDLATVEAELGLTGGAEAVDGPVKRLINGASDRIESYLNRTVWFRQRTSYLGTPGGPAPSRLIVQGPIYPPVIGSILQVNLNLDPGIFNGVTTTLVPGQDFYLEDAAAGFLFQQARWQSTALLRPDIIQDWDPEAVEKDTQVIYLGGWITQQQIDTVGAWAAGTIVPGTLILGQANQVWCCTIGGVTGGSQPAWVAAPAQFATQSDGAVTWTFLGWTNGVTTTPQARTLPFDIEQAALDTVVNWYRRRGSSVEATSEKFMNAALTYGTRLGLPTTALELLAPYRFVALA